MTGEELRNVRLNWNLTQKGMADFLCCHPQTISEMERGKKPISKLIDKVITQDTLILTLQIQLYKERLATPTKMG